MLEKKLFLNAVLLHCLCSKIIPLLIKERIFSAFLDFLNNHVNVAFAFSSINFVTLYVGLNLNIIDIILSKVFLIGELHEN